MNLGKVEIGRNIEPTRIPGSVSIKEKTNIGETRIEKSTNGTKTKIMISEGITPMILTSTGEMASVPIYMIMDIVVSVFLQGIILHLA